MPTQSIVCGGCPARWTGLTTAHCAGCHRTFGGIAGFDAHRVRGACTDPRAHGMTDVAGTWQRPAPTGLHHSAA